MAYFTIDEFTKYETFVIICMLPLLNLRESAGEKYQHVTSIAQCSIFNSTNIEQFQPH